MRAVIQRVKKAHVTAENAVVGHIEIGLLVLLGIEEEDNEEDAQWLVGKIVRMRIFSDPNGLMNLSVNDVEGTILVVSQFTLHAATKKGNRPSFIRAAKPEKAIPLYTLFISELQKETRNQVQTGIFGAMMEVHLINDGPVTIVMDTKDKE